MSSNVSQNIKHESLTAMSQFRRLFTTQARLNAHVF